MASVNWVEILELFSEAGHEETSSFHHNIIKDRFNFDILQLDLNEFKAN